MPLLRRTRRGLSAIERRASQSVRRLWWAPPKGLSPGRDPVQGLGLLRDRLAVLAVEKRRRIRNRRIRHEHVRRRGGDLRLHRVEEALREEDLREEGNGVRRQEGEVGLSAPAAGTDSREPIEIGVFGGAGCYSSLYDRR